MIGFSLFLIIFEFLFFLILSCSLISDSSTYLLLCLFFHLKCPFIHEMILLLSFYV